MPTDTMTLEQAHERILDLTEQLEQERQTNATLSQNNETLTADIENLRTLNQKYFNKLVAQELTADNKEVTKEGENTPTCDQLAKDLYKKGVF